MNLNFRTKLLVFGTVVFLITAFFSAGYHHPDEHFQILEFANFKLGNSPAADLPWEFQARIRPGLQPALAVFFIKTMHSLGIENPFTEVLILRILGALLSVLLFFKISGLSAAALPSKNGSDVLLALTLFLWFMPYLQVRFSSECWSGLAFLAATIPLLSDASGQSRRPAALFVAGALLGIAFFLRFQMGFAILGVFAWLISRKAKVRELAVFVGGGLLAGALCSAIDFWFYGEWVFTPYEYFKANIIEQKATEWGVSPWWFYFSEFIVKGIPPLSLILLFLFFYGLYWQRRHLFAWALLPYLLAHILVDHKELRFLFPMVFPFLFFVTAGWGQIGAAFSRHRFLKVALGLSLAVNGVLLIFKSLTPAQEAIPYYQFLYTYAAKQPTTVFTEEIPAYNLVGLNLNFYTSKNIRVITLYDFFQLDDSLLIRPKPGDLLLSRGPALPALNKYQPKHVFSIFPGWVLKNNFNHWQDRSGIWSVYEF